MIDKRKLIEAGVHFGHQRSKWSPKMKPFLYGYRNNIHLIDVSKTAYMLEKAAKFLESIASENKSILLVGTKKAAQETVYKLAKELNLPYVINRWVGGTFSNFRQVKKSVAKYLHYEDILAKSEQFPYSKKELNVIQKKFDRLNKSVGGIRNLTWPIGAVIVVDVKKEQVCVKEAVSMGIPIVAIIDTNSDPSSIDYPIPANDDAPRSIDLILSYLAENIASGQKIAESKPKKSDIEQDVFESVFDTGEEESEEAKAKKQRNRRSQGATRATKKPVKTQFTKKTVNKDKNLETETKETKTESKSKSEENQDLQSGQES